ncbi:MAG TPA: hypothetical protein VFM03_05275, partial [Candidatus Limnocylindria bacterium]|nr:hypothetical protein [Candidatus Limnocylindria bacterium]
MSRDAYPPLRPQPPVRPVRRRRRSTPPPSTLAGAVVLLAFIVVVGALLWSNRGDGGAAVDPSGSAAIPSASAAASGVASTSASPLASGSVAPSSTPAPGFAADSLLTLTAEALTLRAEPGVGAAVLARLPAGQTAFVLAGPEMADGLPWYHLSGLGLPYGTGCTPPPAGGVLECPAWIGWVAAADEAGAPWVEPAAAPTCAEGPPTLVSVTEMPYTMRLICFDAQDMTFRAFWPTIPEGAGPGGSCPASGAPSGWLVCQNINPSLLAADEAEGAGGGGRLAVNIVPGSGLAMPSRGQWVEVTGHFDDPAAQECAGAADLMA